MPLSSSQGRSLAGKVALVTGANRGIGFEVVRTLLKQQCVVWLGVRDFTRGEVATRRLADEGLDAKCLALDVTDDASVQRAAAEILSSVGRLDILVNNAGIAIDHGSLPSEMPMERIRATFDTNVFGCIRVTQAFLPLLRKSPAARIVMVSSDIGSHGHQINPNFPYYHLNPMGYGASKAALNAVTISFAKELRNSPAKVNAANPSFTATDLNGFQGTLTVAQGAAPIITLATLPDDGPTGIFLGPNGEEPW